MTHGDYNGLKFNVDGDSVMIKKGRGCPLFTSLKIFINGEL